MMRMHYGGGGFGYGYEGSTFLCAVICIVVLIDLVLLGVWLWQKIRREEREGCTHKHDEGHQEHHEHDHHH